MMVISKRLKKAQEQKNGIEYKVIHTTKAKNKKNGFNPLRKHYP
jgi:hypothetical protein